jgi:hypothetical protein
VQAGTRVDLAFVLYGTLCHMLRNDDALAMFSAAAASLAPQGIFVVEMTHPVDLLHGMLEHGDVWEVSRGRWLCTSTAWSPAPCRHASGHCVRRDVGQ